VVRDTVFGVDRRRVTAWTRNFVPITGAALLSAAVAWYLVRSAEHEPGTDEATTGVRPHATSHADDPPPRAPAAPSAARDESRLAQAASAGEGVAHAREGVVPVRDEGLVPKGGPLVADGARMDTERSTGVSPGNESTAQDQRLTSPDDEGALVASKAEHAMARAREQLAAKDYEHARWSFQRALSYRADHPEALAGLAFSLLGQQQARAAIQVFRRALEVAPRDVALHVGLAQAYAQDGNFTAAAESYERALALHPGDADARAGLDGLPPR
jgi:tetratricopeptide (TPR) repeat protein